MFWKVWRSLQILQNMATYIYSSPYANLLIVICSSSRRNIEIISCQLWGVVPLSVILAASRKSLLASRDLPEVPGTLKMVPVINVERFEVAGEHFKLSLVPLKLSSPIMGLLWMALLNLARTFKTVPVINTKEDEGAGESLIDYPHPFKALRIKHRHSMLVTGALLEVPAAFYVAEIFILVPSMKHFQISHPNSLNPWYGT